MAIDDHAPGYVPNPNYTRADWDEVSDNPELTAEQIAQAKPLRDVLPGLGEAVARRRGPQKTETKQLVSLRLDKDMLGKYRETGPGWQGRMNEVLRKAIGL